MLTAWRPKEETRQMILRFFTARSQFEDEIDDCFEIESEIRARHSLPDAYVTNIPLTFFGIKFTFSFPYCILP